MARQRRVSGEAVEHFPSRARTQWDFGAVADGRVYLLRRGTDFEIEVASLAAAARHWAREHGYQLQTRSQFDEDHPERPRVGIYVRFEPRS